MNSLSHIKTITKLIRSVFLGLALWVSALFPQDFLQENDYLYPYLIDFIRNPEYFMRGYQYEADNVNPIYGKKYMPPEWLDLTQRKTDDIFINDWRYRFSLSVNVTSLVHSLMNYSFKITAFREDVLIPEIYFGFGHYFYIPIYKGLLDGPYRSMLENISMHSFSGFLAAAKSVRSNIKVFGGYRFAYGFMEMAFPDGLPDIIALFHNQDINAEWMLHDLIAGVTYLIPGSSWETLITIGFNPELLFFGGKLEFLYKYIGIGLGYYANRSIIPFRPFVRLQYEF